MSTLTTPSTHQESAAVNWDNHKLRPAACIPSHTELRWMISHQTLSFCALEPPQRSCSSSDIITNNVNKLKHSFSGI